MSSRVSQLDLLQELAPIAEKELNRHVSMSKPWSPHDLIPWDEGRDFAALGGKEWDPEQSRLSEVAQAALLVNLLTEDNLPSYHREISENFSLDHPWGAWAGLWTAEENRHSIVMRDYLVVTRGVDPVKLEQIRFSFMTKGWDTQQLIIDKAEDPRQVVEYPALLRSLAYTSMQELATRVSHRNTATVCNDPVAEAILQRVSADENLHMIFYRNMLSAAIDLSPDDTMASITKVIKGFQMPGAAIPDFRRLGVLIAKHGIYDLRQHRDEVLMPVLRKWRVFERTDFGETGETCREELAVYMDSLENQAQRFEEMRDRALAREAKKREMADA